MFPTLYPLGIGGFEDHRQSHVQHLLDQSLRNFRYHYFFSFVALNVIQRRKAHLHTSLSISSNKYHYIAFELLAVTPNILSNLASKLKNEKDEQHAFRLLKEVNIIAAKIPGSQASKTKIRQQIRSYFAYFAVHSPVFQVMYGDQNVNLSQRFPVVVQPRSERAYRVAHDPVAAADFFDFMYHVIFQDLFGWDFKNGKSTQQGGLFGHLRAFYGCAELTERLFAIKESQLTVIVVLDILMMWWSIQVLI
ncbi:hypothetical protein EV368DRAFT_72726 [Lentinula lateritia]|nr:hypothetical protein EV368DRAFT_72726 [Lentinula lateritia]